MNSSRIRTALLTPVIAALLVVAGCDGSVAVPEVTPAGQYNEPALPESLVTFGNGPNQISPRVPARNASTYIYAVSWLASAVKASGFKDLSSQTNGLCQERRSQELPRDADGNIVQDLNDVVDDPQFIGTGGAQGSVLAAIVEDTEVRKAGELTITACQIPSQQGVDRALEVDARLVYDLTKDTAESSKYTINIGGKLKLNVGKADEATLVLVVDEIGTVQVADEDGGSTTIGFAMSIRYSVTDYTGTGYLVKTDNDLTGNYQERTVTGGQLTVTAQDQQSLALMVSNSLITVDGGTSVPFQPFRADE